MSDTVERLRNALEAEMADHGTCDREKDSLMAALDSERAFRAAVDRLVKGPFIDAGLYRRDATYHALVERFADITGRDES